MRPSRSSCICIVDTNASGMPVARAESRNSVLPALRAFHWMKRGSAWWHLRQ